MDILREILLVIHLLGFAALFGGLVVQAGSDEPKHVNGAMRDGAGTAFLAGIIMLGLLEMQDAAVDHAKMGVKLVIALIVLVLVMANNRKQQIPQGLWAGLLVLTLANAAIGVMWGTTHNF